MNRMLLVSPDGQLFSELMLGCASRYLLPNPVTPGQIQQTVFSSPPDVILVDGSLKHEELLQLLDDHAEIFSRIPVILLFRPPAPDFIRLHEYLAAGAAHLLTMPIHLAQLQKTVSQAVFANPPLLPEDKNESFIGKSAQSRSIRTLIDRFAGSNQPVLITGESGTGKEVVAKALFEKSQQSNEVFCKRNCAAIPETLFESELFGSTAGAYTNAIDRQGIFEFASQGCIFLDEIGTLSPGAQGKLLRVLEDGEFSRLGENKTRKSRSRMIFATNEDLESKIEKKEFRLDLFYRISVLKIRIPPLRERKADIIPLAHHIIHEENSDKILSPGAAERLEAHSWPGNVRELKNVLLRGMVMSKNRTITHRDIMF